MKRLTPADIRNPARLSGYSYVQQDTRTKQKPFQAFAYIPGGGPTRPRWFGEARVTAVEAAQDYCDYINSGAAPTPALKLKSAGHTGRRDSLPSDPEVQAALGVLRDARGARRGRQGYVYLIAETLEANPLLVHTTQMRGANPLLVKIGYSTNPQARLAELQTANGRMLKLLAYFPGTIADENALHAKYKHLNTVQEWFRPTVALLSEFGLYADGSRRAAA